MSVKRNSYTEEFKEEARKLAESIGISKTAKDLGVNPGSIRQWINNSSKDINKNTSNVEKELAKLKKENLYLRKINDVLKKSLGIFAMEDQSNF